MMKFPCALICTATLVISGGAAHASSHSEAPGNYQRSALGIVDVFDFRNGGRATTATFGDSTLLVVGPDAGGEPGWASLAIALDGADGDDALAQFCLAAHIAAGGAVEDEITCVFGGAAARGAPLSDGPLMASVADFSGFAGSQGQIMCRGEIPVWLPEGAPDVGLTPTSSAGDTRQMFGNPDENEESVMSFSFGATQTGLGRSSFTMSSFSFGATQQASGVRQPSGAQRADSGRPFGTEENSESEAGILARYELLHGKWARDEKDYDTPAGGRLGCAPGQNIVLLAPSGAAAATGEAIDPANHPDFAPGAPVRIITLAAGNKTEVNVRRQNRFSSVPSPPPPPDPAAPEAPVELFAAGNKTEVNVRKTGRLSSVPPSGLRGLFDPRAGATPQSPETIAGTMIIPQLSEPDPSEFERADMRMSSPKRPLGPRIGMGGGVHFSEGALDTDPGFFVAANVGFEAGPVPVNLGCRASRADASTTISVSRPNPADPDRPLVGTTTLSGDVASVECHIIGAAPLFIWASAGLKRGEGPTPGQRFEVSAEAGFGFRNDWVDLGAGSDSAFAPTAYVGLRADYWLSERVALTATAGYRATGEMELDDTAFGLRGIDADPSGFEAGVGLTILFGTLILPNNDDPDPSEFERAEMR